jgi:hypothetical protein
MVLTWAGSSTESISMPTNAEVSQSLGGANDQLSDGIDDDANSYGSDFSSQAGDPPDYLSNLSLDEAISKPTVSFSPRRGSGPPKGTVNSTIQPLPRAGFLSDNNCVVS